MAKVAVLGGNGYLGTQVADYFKADKLSRSTGFDITNLEDVSRLEKYDVIIHLAAKVDKSGKEDSEVMRVNIEGSRNVAEILGPEQVLVFASSKEIYTPEELQDSYGRSKRIAEEEIQKLKKEKGFRLGIFRMATTYADSDRGSFVNYFVDSVQNERELNLKLKGKQVRDFLYVSDLSRAFEKFIESNIENETWDIGGGKDNAYSFLEFLEIAGKVTGKKPLIKFSDEIVPKNQIKHITNLEKIAKDLDWKPEIGLRAGIEKLIFS